MTGTASFTPQFDDIQSNYHLIAVADANGATSGIEFDGGIFYAQSVTASAPQNILYVFGNNSSDPPGGGTDTAYIHGSADSPADSVVFDGGSPFYYSTLTPPITGIHVRGEYANDTFEADADVTLPLWLFGGEGNSTLTGGAGNNIIVGGSGTNVIHDGDGQSSPQVVDSSETLAAFPSLANYYHETGTWTDDPTPGTAYNGGQRLHAAGAGDTATWTFANVDPTAYYDVYVTWSPEADASTTADYSVNDGGGAMDPIGQSDVAPENQTEAPYDVQAAGASWQELGVFQAGSGALNVQLAADASSPVLANAVMIVPYETVPLTNLTIGSFTVDSQGNLSVSYTINGEDAPPFNIGIYGSPDGRQATNLLQTYPITDPTLLGGGGQSYTVAFPASLDGINSNEYVVAQLDSGDAVEETSKADNISAPLSGVFEQSDGTLVVLGNASFLTNDNISLTQDPVTGNVTINTADAVGNPVTTSMFSGVASVIISTPGGNNTVSVDPSVTVPVSAYAGPGSSVTGTASLITNDMGPQVMIGATLPVASEYLGSGCEFAVTCGDGLAGNVTVNFTLGGSATDGVDYTLSGSGLTVDAQTGTITMPGDGPTTVIIYVTPSYPYPAVSGPSNTVTFTLNSGTGYNVVSGWSTATDTIYYDYPFDCENPVDEEGVTMACYTPVGSQVNSESAPVGDFIPVGLAAESPVANPTTVWGILTYDSCKFSVSYPNGEYIPSGTEIPLTPAETIVDVTAADPSADQANGQDVSGDLTLSGGQFTSVTLNTCSVGVDFQPLQLLRDSFDVTDGTPQTNSHCNAVIGQKINLQIVDPAGRPGLVDWTPPDGVVVKNYQPTTAPNSTTAVASCSGPTYLQQADLKTVMLSSGAKTVSWPLSFAWISPGTGLNVSAAVWDPFGSDDVGATFNVATPYNSANRQLGVLFNAAISGLNDPVRVDSVSLHYGVHTFGDDGIQFGVRGMNTVPASEAGQVCVVQIANFVDNYLINNVRHGIGKLNLLDDGNGKFPYKNLPLPAGPGGAEVNTDMTDDPFLPTNNAYSFITATESYTDYLMYKPNGGIWVTLEILTWGWSGTAINLGGNKWQLDATRAPSWIHGTLPLTPGGPLLKIPGRASTTFPTWNDLASKYVNQANWPVITK